ncbi:hypothetical protein EQM14_00345 [Caproiciproducens sp. NJN-50]|uniref:hypothetical protein n=1 Tax=Acutalibacteraceae TaxID=3082771 RepID=UPI000FFE0732|nr:MULTISPECIES: hypothetical protein [Acutalibacteraceae]QAT48350.1 hypothetical protein EQM14_00345 [Caproiciproducens sp. NJN-50]
MKRIKKIAVCFLISLLVFSQMAGMTTPASAHTVVPKTSASQLFNYSPYHVVKALINRFEEHTKNKRKSTYDKHTKPRPGRNSEKKKQKSNWKPRWM